MSRNLILLSAVLSLANTTAAAAKDVTALSLPIIVDPASTNNKLAEVSIATLFGAQPAHYLSVATMQGNLTLADGTTLLETGARLFEHRATGQSFSGPLYCRLVKPKKMSVLLCLADQNADGRFEALWIGGGVVARPDRLDPALPRPSATKQDVSFDPVQYRVGAAKPDEALQVGFYISGSNPLLGQHHFYQAVGAGEFAIPITATHRAARLSGEPSAITIAGATLEVRSLGKMRYAFRIIKGFAAGEQSLVQEYQSEPRIIFVPGG